MGPGRSPLYCLRPSPEVPKHLSTMSKGLPQWGGVRGDAPPIAQPFSRAAIQLATTSVACRGRCECIV